MLIGVYLWPKLVSSHTQGFEDVGNDGKGRQLVADEPQIKMDLITAPESHFLYRFYQGVLLRRLGFRRYQRPLPKEPLDLRSIKNSVSVRIN